METNENKAIFIHIPKTGGTTINTAMQGTYWQTTPDFNYRHIDSKSMISNSADIFNPRNVEKYKDFKLFMMLRNPIDRAISEFSFIKERRDFFSLLKNKPKDLKEYVSNPQTSNGVIKFLLGHKMYSPIKITEHDIYTVLDAIDALPIYTGIFEEFGKSLAYFSENTGVTFNNKLEVKRITFKRPKVDEISNEVKNLIIENNQFDFELYNYCLDKFQNETTKITSKVQFIADKYNHAIPYAFNFCFFEYCLENKAFININLDYFRSLSHYLIKDLQIKDGKLFTKAWLQSFINQYYLQYQNDELAIQLNSNLDPSGDPLTQLELAASLIDDFYKKLNTNPNNRLKFEKENTIIPKKESGFFKKLLFGKK